MVQSDQDFNNHIEFLKWSDVYNSKQRGVTFDENQTPGSNNRNPFAPRILGGNTVLANCDHNELRTTTLKAPRK